MIETKEIWFYIDLLNMSKKTKNITIIQKEDIKC